MPRTKSKAKMTVFLLLLLMTQLATTTVTAWMSPLSLKVSCKSIDSRQQQQRFADTRQRRQHEHVFSLPSAMGEIKTKQSSLSPLPSLAKNNIKKPATLIFSVSAVALSLFPPFACTVQHAMAASTAHPFVYLAEEAVEAGSSPPGSWRQYVPLVVSCLVIADILLGSPVANGVLKFANPEGAAATENDNAPPVDTSKRKERIDTSQVAQDAIDRANNAKELREYLDARKTDTDRMVEMRRKMDQEMQDFDTNLQDMKDKAAEETKD